MGKVLRSHRPCCTEEVKRSVLVLEGWCGIFSCRRANGPPNLQEALQYRLCNNTLRLVIICTWCVSKQGFRRRMTYSGGGGVMGLLPCRLVFFATSLSLNVFAVALSAKITPQKQKTASHQFTVDWPKKGDSPSPVNDKVPRPLDFICLLSPPRQGGEGGGREEARERARAQGKGRGRGRESAPREKEVRKRSEADCTLLVEGGPMWRARSRSRPCRDSAGKEHTRTHFVVHTHVAQPVVPPDARLGRELGRDPRESSQSLRRSISTAKKTLGGWSI